MKAMDFQIYTVDGTLVLPDTSVWRRQLLPLSPLQQMLKQLPVGTKVNVVTVGSVCEDGHIAETPHPGIVHLHWPDRDVYIDASTVSAFELFPEKKHG